MKSHPLFTRFHGAEEIDESGFTLIELLIVVVIMGILAAVVAFAVGSFASTSAAAACNTDAKSVQTAVSAYYAQTGAYPGWTGSPATFSEATAETQLVGNYLHSWPANATYTLSLDATTPGQVDVALIGTDPGLTGTGAVTSGKAYSYDLTGATSPYTGGAFANDNVCAGA